MHHSMLLTGVFAFVTVAGPAISTASAATKTGGAQRQSQLQQHVPSLLNSASLQNDDLSRDFKWQSFNLAPNQQTYLPVNNNNALNWLAFLSPSALQASGYNQPQTQSQQLRQLPVQDSYYNDGSGLYTGQQPSSGSLDPTERRHRHQGQQYFNSQQNPSYNDPYSQPSGGLGGWLSLYSQALLAQLLYNPLYQQGLQQYTAQNGGGSASYLDLGSVDGIAAPPRKPPGRTSPRQPSANDAKQPPNRPRPSGSNLGLHRPPVRAVTTPPPVLVPATSTARPRPREKPSPPLKCETASNGGCYALVREPMRYADALSYCEKHGMYLASATDANIELLNRLITDGLSKNDTNPSRPCHERITMLANFDGTRQMRYGTYAFTMGGGSCATPATADENSGFFYEVCTKEYDCTLVDWNVPNPFICAKDDKYEPWAVEPIFSDNFYNYFVTSKSIPSPVTELKYPPMCLPFEFGDQVKMYGDHVLKFKKITETSLLSNFVLPQVGAIMMCVPDVECALPSYKEHQYGLCRREKRIDPDELVQLWPRSTLSYRFSGWPSGTEQNVSRIRETMDLIQTSSNACLKFKEVKDNDVTGAVVQISPGNSPNSCSIDSVGRKSGIQVIAYGSQCFNEKKPGLLMRPLLHQLGVPAEHTRFDRDESLVVNEANVISDPLFKLQAAKQPIPGRLSLETPYDYDSVTHYPPEALAKQKAEHVFMAKNPAPGIVLGQRSHLSDGDKLKLRKLYGECKHQ